MLHDTEKCNFFWFIFTTHPLIFLLKDFHIYHDLLLVRAICFFKNGLNTQTNADVTHDFEKQLISEIFDFT